LFLFLLGCKTESSTRSYDNDVQAIIVANIKETIGIGDSAKMTYRFPRLDCSISANSLPPATPTSHIHSAYWHPAIFPISKNFVSAGL
jgi:hypothetical protein